MIRITVELLSARTGIRSTLGVMDICNLGTRPFGDPRGDYKGIVYRKGTKKVLRVGSVINYPRKAYNIWRLVSRMLRDAFPEEK